MISEYFSEPLEEVVDVLEELRMINAEASPIALLIFGKPADVVFYKLRWSLAHVEGEIFQFPSQGEIQDWIWANTRSAQKVEITVVWFASEEDKQRFQERLER
ncbi:MAG: hypothetical protein JWN34_2146 [Bryobacterales bacterium]|nr:hypothetical protein [Bryobacterales bacterium]